MWECLQTEKGLYRVRNNLLIGNIDREHDIKTNLNKIDTGKDYHHRNTNWKEMRNAYFKKVQITYTNNGRF